MTLVNLLKMVRRRLPVLDPGRVSGVVLLGHLMRGAVHRPAERGHCLLWIVGVALVLHGLALDQLDMLRPVRGELLVVHVMLLSLNEGGVAPRCSGDA